MVGHTSAGPLWACVKIVDCCDPSSTGTLTCVKSLETFVESTFAIVPERSAIGECFFSFGEDD
jgi:hypothetical protein